MNDRQQSVAYRRSVERPWRRSVVTALLVAISWTTPIAAGEETANRLPIVSKSIEYHGGELFRSTDTTLKMCSKSGCSNLRARIDGDHFSLEAETQRQGERTRVRSTNDSVARWVDGFEQPIATADEQRWRDWVMQRIYFVFLPYRLDDPSVRQHDLGLVDWGGKPLHQVKVTFAAGTSTDADDEFMYWFEPDTGLMVQFAYSYSGSPGGLRFRRLYNFRRLRGVAFYDQENLGVEGEDLSVGQITKSFVDARMRLVSRIELSDLAVSPVE